jgi:hypothetical protein
MYGLPISSVLCLTFLAPVALTYRCLYAKGIMFNWFKKKPSAGPDFSRVDSREKAELLFRKGELEKLYLMPLDYGGVDAPMNVVFVPLGIAEIKAGIDNNVIGPLAENGTISHYSATPEYHGKSFIPISVTIVASEPGRLESTINIWGPALLRTPSAQAR